MFFGLKFLGATRSLLPDEMRWEGAVYLSDPRKDLEAVRAWAIEDAMFTEEDQFITDDTVEEISKVFTPEDDLSLAVHVARTTNGDMYLEYPFVPMNTLVTRDLEVAMVYWAMEPDPRRSGGHSDHRGVRFGLGTRQWGGVRLGVLG